ncbi:MAG: hypothetical protein H6646_08995 [Anaerolineales bacterium]|nr:hypothetical protein [Anaerolineales bacterium]
MDLADGCEITDLRAVARPGLSSGALGGFVLKSQPADLRPPAATLPASTAASLWRAVCGDVIA